MDDVAAAAGVGKGTLYRRFGDRSTLLRALIEEPERDFQDELIRGIRRSAPARRRRSGCAPSAPDSSRCSSGTPASCSPATR